MRKDNNVNYNTKDSDIKAFKDINPKEEVTDLKKDQRTFGLENEDDRYNLPNKKKLRYNKITKTWQNVSKDEIKDKIKAIEKIKIKSFDEVINEDNVAFGEKELNSETFLLDLKNDIFKHKGNLKQIINIIKTSHTLTTLNEIEIYFNDILELIENRHKDYLKREGF